MKCTVITLFISLFICCSPRTENKGTGIYFSLKNYFQNEIIRLQGSGTISSKSVSKDIKTENAVIHDVNWKQELQPFMDADINKPSWKGMFKTDSIILNDTLILKYQTEDDKINIRSLQIFQYRNKVTAIKITSEKKNSYYKAYQELNYNPDSGYTISGSQKVIMADPVNYRITAQFIYPD